MRYYDTNLIKNYIEKNKDTIDHVFAGMHEDWFWTAYMIYTKEEGYLSSFNWESEFLTINGINGSIWDTPVLKVCLQDGNELFVACYTEIDDKKDFD